MRWSLLLLLVAIPTMAFAEPKVAIAPLDGDADGKVSDVVAEAAGERAKVTRPARVESAMRSMGVSVLSAKTIKKLRAKLDVDVVIYGSVERDGGTKRLELTVAGGGKKPKLEVEFKSPKELRKDLAAKLAKRIGTAMEGAGGDDEEDEEEAERRAEKKRLEEEREKKRLEEEREKKREEEERARKREEEERARKREEEERERKREEQARKKRRDDDDDDDRKKRRDDDDDRKKKRDGDDDDDDDRKKKRGDDEEDGGILRKKRGGDDEEDEDDRKKRKKRVAEEDEEDGDRVRKRLDDEDEADEDEEDSRPRKRRRRSKRHVLTQTALWLDGGGAFARRTLTWDATGNMQPPRVGTAAAAGRIEGEVYPGAFSSVSGIAAGFGAYGHYNYTFGLGIAVPGTTITTPIKNGHYAVGARYRFVFGMHSLALGVSYWRRYYMADRTKLMNPDQLDMPDVDYAAVAPGAALRIAAGPKLAAFGTFDFPLMLESGPIQDPAKSYGASKILAFDVRAGAQYVLTDHVALQIAAELDQIGMKFTGQAGSKAVTRNVSKATDRSIGLAATIGVTY